MIVEFFNRGTGVGEGSVDYLLGRRRDRLKARLLRGHDLETIELINSLDFKKKYTSGCLSFEEDDISESLKYQLMDDFEEALFPGLDKNQYSVLWVEHKDKGRLELNFVIPNVELTTGKRLQPYYVGADFHRIDAWKDITNIKYGFSDPKDPARRQSTSFSKDLPLDKKEAVILINSAVEEAVLSGVIRNRKDVVRYLSESGLEVARETRKSISLRDPDGGRNIRLKGAIYERDFEFSRELAAEIKGRSREYKVRNAERFSRAQKRYLYGLRKRRADLEKRYRTVSSVSPKSLSEENPGNNGELQRLSESSRDLAQSISPGGAETISTERGSDIKDFRAELKAHGDINFQNLADPIEHRANYSRGVDIGSYLFGLQSQRNLFRDSTSREDLGNSSETSGRSDDSEVSDKGWEEFTLCRVRSKVQRKELAGWKDRERSENSSNEGIIDEYGDTAIIVERLNRINQRISETKRGSEQSRTEVNRRLREITERSEYANRKLSENTEELFRNFNSCSENGSGEDFLRGAERNLSENRKALFRELESDPNIRAASGILKRASAEIIDIFNDYRERIDSRKKEKEHEGIDISL